MMLMEVEEAPVYLQRKKKNRDTETVTREEPTLSLLPHSTRLPTHLTSALPGSALQVRDTNTRTHKAVQTPPFMPYLWTQ